MWGIVFWVGGVLVVCESVRSRIRFMNFAGADVWGGDFLLVHDCALKCLFGPLFRF